MQRYSDDETMAYGRAVTMQEAADVIEAEYKERFGDWILGDFGGPKNVQPQMFRLVVRQPGSGNLRLAGQDYMLITHGKIPQLSFFYVEDGEKMQPVVNYSDKAALRFYVRNEKRILEIYGERDAGGSI